MSTIITAGNPILKMKAQPVEKFDKSLKFLVNDMKKTVLAWLRRRLPFPKEFS